MNTYAYDPYGATTALSGSTANPFGYGGQQLDRASGLYKMGQRYDDPNLARWSAQDLLAGGLENSQSLNRYASVLGNPISLLDASGLCNFACGVLGALYQTGKSTSAGLGQAGNFLAAGYNACVSATYKGLLFGGAAGAFAAPETFGTSILAGAFSGGILGCADIYYSQAGLSH